MGRTMPVVVAIIISLAVSGGVGVVIGAENNVPGRPPNVLYLISDDQAFRDFGFMGNERVHTPNLDALAAKSACFVSGYVPTSVCRPSLVTLLTGLYPHQHGVHFNHGPPGNSGYNRMNSRAHYEKVRHREFGLIGRQPTLPGLLSEVRGYRCFQTGKFWEGHWRNGGFTEGMTTFEPPAKSQTFGGARKLASGERVAHGNGDRGLLIGRETLDPIFTFVEDCEATGIPWMTWYAPYLPHQPHDSPRAFFELAQERPGVEPHELPYFASIAQFDHTVGELVRYLEEGGMAERTLIVLVIDNGWSPSRSRERKRPEEFAPTRESKRAPFDDGLRTPILLRWDGVIEPAIHHELVSSIDLMPTILSAAGIGIRKYGLPGMDLIPVARGEVALDPGRPVFGEIYPGDATSLDRPAGDIAYRWVRQGDHKLIVPHPREETAGAWGDYLPGASPVLFNLAVDPQESEDLFDRKPDLAARLRRLLDDWWDPDEEDGQPSLR